MDMTKGSLSKLIGGEALRTETVDGCFYDVPEVGQRFTLFAKSLTEGHDFRRITTSVVVEAEFTDTRITFTTESGSIYELAVGSPGLPSWAE